MKTFFPALVVLIVSLAAAAPPEGGPSETRFGFLETGRDYVVRFPDGSEIFKTSRAEMTESSYTTATGEKKSGGPVTWNITLNVEVFQVVRFGTGSWVLLRHPSSADDFIRWNAQRRAMAILGGPNVDAIRARPNGQERLTRLKEAAAAKMPTTETWINLDHAVAIAAVPTEDPEMKISIQSIKTTLKN
jgi:hypothetical protein